MSTQDHIATNSITVRCNWSTGVRSLVAGSALGQIVGSNFPTASDHNISQRCYRQHHPSLSLYVTPSFTPLQNNSHNYWSVHCNLCTYYLLANGKASDSDFIEQIPLCVSEDLKQMWHKSAKHSHIYGRLSSDHYYKHFPSEVKTQCSYNSHCAIPHVLQ